MNRKSNILFWIIISVLMFFLFGAVSGNYIYAFYFISFFIPLVILTSWVFNNILVPRFLLKGRMGPFILYCFYLIIVSLDLELIMAFVAFLVISLYDFENLKAIINIYKWMPVLMYLIVILEAFIRVVRTLLFKQDEEKEKGENKRILIRSERKNRSIALTELVYIESMADYLKLYLVSGDIVITREKISSLANILPDNFIRIHRSFIVSLSHLDAYSKEFITIMGMELPISRTYKKEVLERLADF